MTRRERTSINFILSVLQTAASSQTQAHHQATIANRVADPGPDALDPEPAHEINPDPNGRKNLIRI